MKNHSKIKKIIENIVDWYFNAVNNYDDEDNLKMFNDLINSKIACISHKNHYVKRLNSTIKHYEREEFRDYLKNYAKELIKNKLENKQ